MLDELTDAALSELEQVHRDFGEASWKVLMPHVPALLASARAVRKVEALRHEWALKLASNTTAHEQYLECMDDAIDRLDRILEALTAAAEPTAGASNHG